MPTEKLIHRARKIEIPGRAQVAASADRKIEILWLKNIEIPMTFTSGNQCRQKN